MLNHNISITVGSIFYILCGNRDNLSVINTEEEKTILLVYDL